MIQPPRPFYIKPGVVILYQTKYPHLGGFRAGQEDAMCKAFTWAEICYHALMGRVAFEPWPAPPGPPPLPRDPVAQAMEAVVEAWTNPGTHPAYHAAAQARLRQEWPVLARAIEQFVAAARG